MLMMHAANMKTCEALIQGTLSEAFYIIRQLGTTK